MDRLLPNPVDGGGGLNDSCRSCFKVLDGGGDGRRIIKNFLGGGGPNGNARASAKFSFGRGFRILWWLPLLGWAFSAPIITVLYLGFYSESQSCSTVAYISNRTRDSEAVFPSSRIVLVNNNTTIPENLSEVVDSPHDKDDKQGEQEEHKEEEHKEEEHKEEEHMEEEHKEEEHKEEEHKEPKSEENNQERDMSFCNYPSQLTQFHLHECAVHVGRANELKVRSLEAKESPPRIAFMFLTRGELPLEPLWRRYFEGHEEHYSIYVHTNPEFTFRNDSLFYGHQVPSIIASRFSITLVDAMQRLMSFAILDPEHGASNSWFVLACESTIPIRSFNFAYDYLMKSQHSFVESFRPRREPVQWYDKTPEPPCAKELLRKGEMWMAIQLRHVLMVLQDWNIYYMYKRLCNYWCASDEQYIATLLGLEDPNGIANRTVVYVNWFANHRASPLLHQTTDLSIEWFEDIKNRTMDIDGQYHDTSYDAQQSHTHRATRSCYYNGLANSTCFLFARKISGDAREHLENLSTDVLGY